MLFCPGIKASHKLNIWVIYLFIICLLVECCVVTVTWKYNPTKVLERPVSTRPMGLLACVNLSVSQLLTPLGAVQSLCVSSRNLGWQHLMYLMILINEWWINQGLLLERWSMDQQHWYYLGARNRFSGSPHTCWSRLCKLTRSPGYLYAH